MGFSEAVLWWEEWQLRLLVLCGLFIQFFLCFAGYLRKRCIPSSMRFFIWLAFLGSDAVAIYALATIFNRHKKQECVSIHPSSASLQVLWAPILLVHLGGQDGITAYNIEDNELWRRHVLTTVSQVTVAVYVFTKSWSANTPMWWSGFFLFIYGISKCITKPWHLKRVSINSLVDSSPSQKNSEIHSLHQYVRTATRYFSAGSGNHQSDSSENNEVKVEKLYDLLVDLAPSYSDRYSCLKHLVHNGEKAHHLLQSCLSLTFDQLYTKHHPKSLISVLDRISYFGRLVGFCCLPFATFIATPFIFFTTRREAYNDIDVMITYTLLYCTAILEGAGVISMMLFINAPHDKKCIRRMRRLLFQDGRPWPDQVAQYSLIGYLARKKKHSWFRKLASLLVCKDYIDQLWCMKPSKSSCEITKLIHSYIAKGWMEHHIKDIATYRAFNDNRGNWTLKQEACGRNLEWSLRRPFDESVLLWHIATDFCFHFRATPPSNEVARRCRTMSNYMAYLLFVNPEMLMTGARRNLFKAAYREIKRVLKEENPPLDNGGPENTPVDEKELTVKIFDQVMVTHGYGAPHDARLLARYLMDLCDEDDNKMWTVIQGVWVEMLCFSAGRCRGYLHAKSLGKGGEYLSYVWLLMSYMGMETLAERMQRLEVQGAAEEEAAWSQSCRPYIPSNDRRS